MAKETDRGLSSMMAAGCLAGAHSSPSSPIPWPPGIHRKAVMPVRLSSMHLRSEVKAEPLWIALGGDLLSIYMTAASCNTNIHSSVMLIAAFSSSYGEVIAAPCCGLRNDSARSC